MRSGNVRVPKSGEQKPINQTSGGARSGRAWHQKWGALGLGALSLMMPGLTACVSMPAVVGSPSPGSVDRLARATDLCVEIEASGDVSSAAAVLCQADLSGIDPDVLAALIQQARTASQPERMETGRVDAGAVEAGTDASSPTASPPKAVPPVAVAANPRPYSTETAATPAPAPSVKAPAKAQKVWRSPSPGALPADPEAPEESETTAAQSDMSPKPPSLSTPTLSTPTLSAPTGSAASAMVEESLTEAAVLPPISSPDAQGEGSASSTAIAALTALDQVPVSDPNASGREMSGNGVSEMAGASLASPTATSAASVSLTTAAELAQRAAPGILAVAEKQATDNPELDVAALEPVPVSKVPLQLFMVQQGEIFQFPVVYQQVQKLMPGACPDRIRVVRVPYTSSRTEGSAWVHPDGDFIFFRSDEADFYKAPGFDAQLFSLVGRACLANITHNGDVTLSREEKGLRFLEEGFAWYLQTRPELSAVGGRPESNRTFTDFVAQIELAHRFVLSDFWERLPSRKEALDPAVSLHARRVEATHVAGAFVRDLIDEQGLGLPGFLSLWKTLAQNPFRRDADGHLIPQVAVNPVISSFLTVVTGGKILSLDKSWTQFVNRLTLKTFDRPASDLWLEGSTLVVSFSRPMLPEKVDITVDEAQLGPERLLAGLGEWRDDRTIVLDLAETRAQMGFDKIGVVQVNWGRIWQWFRARDGVPAEGALLRIPPDALSKARR